MLENVVKRSEFVYTREQRYTKVIYYYCYYSCNRVGCVVSLLPDVLFSSTGKNRDTALTKPTLWPNGKPRLARMLLLSIALKQRYSSLSRRLTALLSHVVVNE